MHVEVIILEERVENMTNEQMWTLIEMFKSILLMAPDKEAALKELDRIADNVINRHHVFGKQKKIAD